MLLRAIFLVYFCYVGRTLALQCRNCSRSLDLTVPEINIGNSTCQLVEAPYGSCSQRLHIRYMKNTTSAVLRVNPDESLVLSNEAKTMTNTTLIWLSKFQLERIFQIYCFTSDDCEASTINATYAQARILEYSQMWANVVARLYDDQGNSTQLVCADDRNQSVLCPDGFCHLTSSNLATFSSRCVPKSAMNNSYGVILESKTVAGRGVESSISYTCNKPMCNNLTMAKEIQGLFEARELIRQISTTTMTTMLTTRTATASLSSSGEVAKPMLCIQYSFALIMVIIYSK